MLGQDVEGRSGKAFRWVVFLFALFLLQLAKPVGPRAETVQGSVLAGEVAALFPGAAHLLTPQAELRTTMRGGAGGRRSEAADRWEALRDRGNPVLRLTVDGSGLSFPLLVDPLYLTTGALNAGRTYRTATLLNNGRVLVAGGAPRTTANCATPRRPPAGPRGAPRPRPTPRPT